MIAPKAIRDGKNGIRLHAKNIFQEGGGEDWVCDESAIHLGATATALTRVRIAKILDTARLREILGAIPVRPGVAGWTCKTWVQEAIQTLHQLQAAGDVLCRGVLEWQTVHDATIAYTKRKADEGRFSRFGPWDRSKVATWDMLKDRETIP